MGLCCRLAGLVYSIGAMLLSRAADRFGRRPLMIWPVFAYAVISVFGALSPNFWTLAFLVTAGSFMMAGMNPAVHAASRDLTPQMGRAMVYSWVSLAFTIGALLSTVAVVLRHRILVVSPCDRVGLRTDLSGATLRSGTGTSGVGNLLFLDRFHHQRVFVRVVIRPIYGAKNCDCVWWHRYGSVLYCRGDITGWHPGDYTDACLVDDRFLRWIHLSGLVRDLFRDCRRHQSVWGWPTGMVIAGCSSFCSAALVSFGQGPWLPDRRRALALT